jgi:hypothetical protein
MSWSIRETTTRFGARLAASHQHLLLGELRDDQRRVRRSDELDVREDSLQRRGDRLLPGGVHVGVDLVDQDQRIPFPRALAVAVDLVETLQEDPDPSDERRRPLADRFDRDVAVIRVDGDFLRLQVDAFERDLHPGSQLADHFEELV